ncbi:hypothetical protein Acy02nite_68800 [Actinoplanes cyaneus]|uniref:Uncharacterized protein n=1 Tax=Actinoplanes cyaneus TaxID=52696 RepID=A0A919IN55_9ACTN|nr:hypothetical protein [Actinoplanes cyaneus]MCW2139071.1 hypothetical protein [Actinoplanes cyaneus]GID68999.1 hypothetical protein Acy02nite_68800 [Actinoplanes cyaneus]
MTDPRSADRSAVDAPALQGDALIWHNRRSQAQREGWPPERLDEIAALERQHPEWRVSWRAEWNGVKGWESPAGYYARRRRRQDFEPEAYAATADELPAAIQDLMDRLEQARQEGRRLWVRAGNGEG